MRATIDGYAGSGKTSAAAALAAALGWELLPTGAMYRAAGVALVAAGFDLDAVPRDADAIRAALAGYAFELPPGKVLLNGIDYAPRIHCETAGELASKVGAFAEVRERLKAEQRRLAEGRNIVCEGRDQGTSVFPDAPHKFFFWAEAEIRAERRVAQMQAEGLKAEYEEVLALIRHRDRRDETRELDPLRPAADAIRIDTTRQGPDEVLAFMMAKVRA